MKRREFITAAGAGSVATAAGAAGAVGTAAAQEDGGDGGDGGGNGGEGGNVEPAWPDHVTDANNYDETADLRGQDEVQVDVGAGDSGLAFGPAGIWVDPGTNVVWQWTGEGGGHNVSSVDGEDYSSQVTSEQGFTFQHTFEEGGINTYECQPHTSQGMHGGVAVGNDIETQEVQQGPGVDDPEEMGVQIQEHYVGIGAVLAVTVSLIFTFFVLKYGESPNAKGGD